MADVIFDQSLQEPQANLSASAVKVRGTKAAFWYLKWVIVRATFFVRYPSVWLSFWAAGYPECLRPIDGVDAAHHHAKLMRFRQRGCWWRGAHQIPSRPAKGMSTHESPLDLTTSQDHKPASLEGDPVRHCWRQSWPSRPPDAASS